MRRADDKIMGAEHMLAEEGSRAIAQYHVPRQVRQKAYTAMPIYTP